MSVRATIAKYLLTGFVFGVLVAHAGAARAQTMVITVELLTLDASGLDDGFANDDVEAYGTLTIDGLEVRWNNHTCERGCLIRTPPPYTTTIATGTRRNWSTLFLRHDARGFLTGNNRVAFLRRGLADIARPLTVSFRLRDHDSGSGDDTWCRVSGAQIVPPGLTPAAWLIGPRIRSVRASGPDGFCTIRFRVSAT
jgi:hypothetical protein